MPGDPVEIAKAYDAAGADELVFLDITASSDGRGTVIDMVREVAKCVFIRLQSAGESAQWKILKHCFAGGRQDFH